jgi:hypothetical protein
MHYTTELNYSGKIYQLTFFKDSTESPGWMELSSYIMPTVNLTCQLNRWFLDNHASEVLARWGKDDLIAFCTALRLMGARDADFVRLGLKSPAETAEQKKSPLEEKKSQKRRIRKKIPGTSDGAASQMP